MNALNRKAAGRKVATFPVRLRDCSIERAARKVALEKKWKINKKCPKVVSAAVALRLLAPQRVASN